MVTIPISAEPVSARLARTEAAIRAAFTVHESKLLSLPAPEQPRAGATAGQLMAAMAKNAAIGNPVDVVRAWGAGFEKAVQDQLAALDGIKSEGETLKALADHLRGNGAMPAGLGPELRAAAVTLTNSDDKSLALAVARKIDLLVAPQIQEAERVRKTFGAKAQDAAELVIQKRSAEWLIKAGLPDAARPFELRHKALAEKRAAKSKSKKQEIGDE
jgi:hypothetical protein